MNGERQAIQVRFPRRDRSFVPRLEFMKPRLLLVDDDPTVREMIGRVLTEAGYLVLLAANGQEALDFASATEVDLVLLDLNMPVKNGWDTFERLTTENPLDFPTLLETIRTLLDEPAEKRLARIAGKPADFHYIRAQQQLVQGKA